MKSYEKEAEKVYNYAAEEYHFIRTKKYPHGWFYNEMLEMPAMLGLLGNVKGKRIIDVGCGTGIYAKLLTKKGAKVKGFDISPEMIKIAKEENPQLDLKVGSAYNIPFNEKFDIALASLMVHYLYDWDALFSEVSKRLDKGGYFVFSTGNPVAECREKVKYKGRKFRVFGDYFTERKMFGKWHLKNGDLKVFFFHKTYETIIKIIVRNGFEIVDYKDAYPIKKAKKLFPEDYKQCSKVPFFSVWKVRKK
jgi:SAM-dependent methyltransferase